MLISTSCSWCHCLNAVSVQQCQDCGHDAQRPRLECQCPACRPANPAPAGLSHAVNQDTQTFWRWRVFDKAGFCINFGYEMSEQAANDQAASFIQGTWYGL